MTAPKNTWEEEFDEEFPDSRGVFENGDPYGRRRGAIKAFIAHTLASRNAELRERIEGMKLPTAERSMMTVGKNTALDDVLALLTSEDTGV